MNDLVVFLQNFVAIVSQWPPMAPKVPQIIIDYCISRYYLCIVI